MATVAEFAGEMTGLEDLDSGVPPIPMLTTTAAHLRSGPAKSMASLAVVAPNVQIGVLPVVEAGWRLVWMAGWMHESTLAKIKG